jgi:hypothetical protein
MLVSPQAYCLCQERDPDSALVSHKSVLAYMSTYDDIQASSNMKTMHKLIRIISTAEDQDTAAEQAYAFADELVERGDFDHYVVQSERHKESGYTYSLAEEGGKLLVADALKANRVTWQEALRVVRFMLANYLDEAIYQDAYEDPPADMYISRHQFAIVAGYTHDSWIYGDESLWGDKIRNDRDYNMAVEDIEPNQLWVTCLDMHH